MDLAQVRQGLVAAGIPNQLADELLDAYVETKRRYHLGDHRPQEVEGGRFSEAALRILQHLCGLAVTPLARTLPPFDQNLLTKFENAAAAPESVRIHIPRTLRLIYGIRNTRDAAHLADGIDPNLQDATLVISNMNWVMAEFVRLYHGVTADQAQQIIEDLVAREVPAVQEIDGQPVILADLQPRDQALLMLYRAGAQGATLDDMTSWLRSPRKSDLKKRLLKLDTDKLALFHPSTARFYITSLGSQYVERKKLAQPL